MPPHNMTVHKTLLYNTPGPEYVPPATEVIIFVAVIMVPVERVILTLKGAVYV